MYIVKSNLEIRFDAKALSKRHKLDIRIATPIIVIIAESIGCDIWRISTNCQYANYANCATRATHLDLDVWHIAVSRKLVAILHLAQMHPYLANCEVLQCQCSHAISTIQHNNHVHISFFFCHEDKCKMHNKFVAHFGEWTRERERHTGVLMPFNAAVSNIVNFDWCTFISIRALHLHNICLRGAPSTFLICKNVACIISPAILLIRRTSRVAHTYE